MFETQKSGNKISLGEISLNSRPYASPKVGQEQVSRGVIVPYWLATRVADALWKPIFGEMSHLVKMLSFVYTKCLIDINVTGFNKMNKCKSQKGQDQVSGRVSVLCWHVAFDANVLWKPREIR